jgi:PAS domain S-box-containing protein
MKKEQSERLALGPILTLMAGLILALMEKSGFHIEHNEGFLITIVVFSGFYSGLWSALASAGVAAALFALTLGSHPVLAPFFDPAEAEEIAAILPIIIVMVVILRSRLDRRVKESEEGYRLVVENIDEVFFVIAADFSKLIYISPAYERVWGRPTAELYEKPATWLEVVHPEDRQGVQESLGKFTKSPSGSKLVQRFRLKRGDGSIRWIASKSLIIRDDPKSPGRLIGFSSDITAEVEAEHKEKEAANRLKTILASAPIAIFATDKEGVLTMREGKGGTRAGVRTGQDVGVSYFEQFKDVPKHLENVRRALAGETVTDRLIVRQGFFEIVYAPLRGKEGAVDGMVGVATDTTELHSAELKVKDLDIVKDNFITVVSHQLRTPLSAIRWNQEMLLNDELGRLKPEQKDVMKMTYAAVGEVITRINDFMLALDIESGRITIAKGAIRPESVWQSVMADLKKRCDMKGLKCVYRTPKPPIPDIEADPAKLRTLFEKIAENAVQYTAEGTVTAKMTHDGRMFRFEVTDTGIGIPSAEQGRIFDRFYRASNAFQLRTDASGLGLYIAKHFAEAHGGTLGFTSVEGKGSTFWFEIPVV